MSALSLLVSAVMAPEPRTARPSDNLADVRRMMTEVGGHHVPVVDGSRFVGLLSPMDLLNAAGPDAHARNLDQLDAELAAVTAQHAMSEDVVTIRPEATVREACGTLATGALHCLPVVDAHGALRGLLTTTDILRTMLETEPPG